MKSNATELGMAQEPLCASEEEFRRLAEAMPQIIWAADAAGRLKYVNQHWREYTGLEWAGENELRQAVHPDDQHPFFTSWASTVARGSPFQAEVRLRRADGTYRWFLARSVPVPGSQGRLLRWYGTATDIDDQKRAEESLRQLARRKEEFLAMLAHELRNPLAPLRNTLYLLRVHGTNDPVISQMGGVMERQINHLVRLVDDLLDMSRISRGKIDLRGEPIDLAALISRVVQDFRPLMVERQHHLDVSQATEPLAVLGEPARLEQVLAHLLQNAAKYTPPGGHIRLAVERAHEQAVIRVRDDGIGVRPEMLPHIFDLFQQADPLPGRMAEGLGLGLALVRGLVELHGGSVAAHSEGQGRGSEFVVRLPLLRRGQLESGTGMDGQAGRAVQPLRILICDDSEDGANSLALLLRLQGHTVWVTHDGPAALEAACNHRPEVVLLDIGLPGMDGYEVARRLRQEAEMKNALLIALTGYGQEEDRRRTQRAGFAIHLVKPVDPEALEEGLARATRFG